MFRYDNKRIKVGFFIPDMIVGGVETVFLLTLEELLKKTDYKIIVFMRASLQEPFYKEWFKNHPDVKLYTIAPLVQFFEGLKKYTKIFPLENIRKIIFGTYKRYKRWRFKAQDIDVFIDYKNFSFSTEFGKIEKPKIVWCHGSFDFFEKHNFITRMHQYSKLVAITESFTKDFCKKYPQYSDKIEFIYNPVDCESIINKLHDAPVFDGQYFCSVARLDKEKDIKTIIVAFNNFWIKAGEPNIDLLLVGDGPDRAMLEQLAQTLPSKTHIIFIGTATNPFGYMKGAMAHILSSYNEGFGMVMAEAATVGTLNVASNCKNGPAEILLDGRAGLLFPVGDSQKLSELMSDIYNKQVPAEQMIKLGKKSLDRFSISQVSEKIINLIDSQIK